MHTLNGIHSELPAAVQRAAQKWVEQAERHGVDIRVQSEIHGMASLSSAIITAKDVTSPITDELWIFIGIGRRGRVTQSARRYTGGATKPTRRITLKMARLYLTQIWNRN